MGVAYAAAGFECCAGCQLVDAFEVEIGNIAEPFGDYQDSARHYRCWLLRGFGVQPSASGDRPVKCVLCGMLNKQRCVKCWAWKLHRNIHTVLGPMLKPS